MDGVKGVIIGICTGIMAFLEPIASNVFAMMYLTLINFVVGLLVSLLVENENFSWRKLWQCGKEALVFLGICASIYIIGHAQGNSEGAIQCVSMVVYLMCYFYATKILRNLRKAFNKGSVGYHVVNALYLVLTLEAIKNIPYLQDYMEQEKEDGR